MNQTPIETIIELFATRGAQAYVGEPVSQLEHALQAAGLALQFRASDALVTAALLHDVGHLLHDAPEHAAETGIDARHEDLGTAWLSRFFPEAVTEPIRLHVVAKRYLCAVDEQYAQSLSPASARSLALQGGPMPAWEMESFEERPYWEEAVMLRSWDDAAKIPGLKVPDLVHYRPIVRRSLTAARGR